MQTTVIVSCINEKILPFSRRGNSIELRYYESRNSDICNIYMSLVPISEEPMKAEASGYEHHRSLT